MSIQITNSSLEGLPPQEIVERLKRDKSKTAAFKTYDEMSRSNEKKAVPTGKKEPKPDMVRNVPLMEMSDEDFEKIRKRMEAKFGNG